MPANAGIGVFEAFSSLLGKSGENTNASERSEQHCLICSTPLKRSAMLISAKLISAKRNEGFGINAMNGLVPILQSGIPDLYLYT
jgi:hypothetical protein